MSFFTDVIEVIHQNKWPLKTKHQTPHLTITHQSKEIAEAFAKSLEQKVCSYHQPLGTKNI